jgi:hypothetical protein
MDQKGRAGFRKSLPFLLITACVSVQSACQYPGATPPPPAAVSPVPAVTPAVAAPVIQLADGTWTVRGTRVTGSRRCGEWLVRLTSLGGQLSGTVSHARNTAVPIQNLVLLPDGSFSGSTGASMSGSRRAPPATVTGQFSGGTVNVTFDSERCAPRQGTATRHALGG